MTIHLIPDQALVRYSAAPSSATVTAVKSLHENIRDVLGGDYETFLQGSYRNNTGVADLNDVDIVALRRTLYSGTFSPHRFPVSVPWDSVFDDVQGRLEASRHYAGKTKRCDKCITVNTVFKADIVPAVVIDDADTDPIAIYSRRECQERMNYPRDHYQRNTEKQARTGDTYKPTVRMYKKWARNWFAELDVAPSFYVECLVHWVPDSKFYADRALSFFEVGYHITQQVSRHTVVNSVAGDKDILTDSEWDWDRFKTFQTRLTLALGDVADALNAVSSSEAERLWKKAFGE